MRFQLNPSHRTLWRAYYIFKSFQRQQIIPGTMEVQGAEVQGAEVLPRHLGAPAYLESVTKSSTFPGSVTKITTRLDRTTPNKATE